MTLNRHIGQLLSRIPRKRSVSRRDLDVCGCVALRCVILQAIANLKGVDENGIVIEMIKYATSSFKQLLKSLLNQILVDVSFEDSWYVKILQMMPNDGDLNEFVIRRPIAILLIFYNIYYK